MTVPANCVSSASRTDKRCACGGEVWSQTQFQDHRIFCKSCGARSSLQFLIQAAWDDWANVQKDLRDNSDLCSSCGEAIRIVDMQEGPDKSLACDPDAKWVILQGRRVLVSIPHTCEVTA